jgi:ribosomal protein L24E
MRRPIGTPASSPAGPQASSPAPQAWWRVISLAVIVGWAAIAFARVGGGESYSGGGSSGGSGGGDGGGELLYFAFRLLLWLTMEYPAIGIPVDLVVLYILIKWWRSKQSAAQLKLSTATVSRGGAKMDALRRFDPNFSEITFSDFCYSVYGLAHYARGKGDLGRYAPYLSAGARSALQGRGGDVRAVVIGACNVVGFSGVEGATVTATVMYESNITEGETSFYVKEQWVMERRRDILSPPPEKAKADHCPRCGAALQTRTDGACDYCGVKIESGAFHWYVRSISLLSRETRGPLLTSNVPERGTDSQTRYQPHFAQRKAAFESEHPDFTWAAFEQRVRAIAQELQDAWTARDWERVRPLETESLFQMHRYWIDAYKRQNLRNIVDGFTITRVEPVKISADPFYEAVTVRLFAQGRDHTDDAGGKTVAGSKTSLRRWSEYWTLIRTKVTVNAAVTCPNCGASVHAGATGVCSYCGGKITVGHFEWILSRIEQDESYRS